MDDGYFLMHLNTCKYTHTILYIHILIYIYSTALNQHSNYNQLTYL